MCDKKEKLKSLEEELRSNGVVDIKFTILGDEEECDIDRVIDDAIFLIEQILEKNYVEATPLGDSQNHDN